jgi:Ca2+-binding RTX toxin-like protein
MAIQDFFDDVQKLYIAYYQRPADPSGLRYWAQSLEAAGGSLAGIIDAFATSPEAVSLYDTNHNGALDIGDANQLIDAIYQALFNRAPDAAGKNFYLTALQTGHFPDGRPATPGRVALDILNGAQGNDLVAIQNKLIVANHFTSVVDGRPLSDPDFGTGTSFAATYNGDADAQAARAFLATVTSNPATVPSQAQVIQEIKTHIANPGDPILSASSGQTFTLTINPDIKTGTSGDDLFNGVADSFGNPTFQSFDQLDGGDGTDTLIAQWIGNLTTTPSTLKNIENLHLVGAVGSGTLDLTNTTGVTHITSEAPTWKYTVGGIGKGIERIDLIAPGSKTQTFQFQPGAVGGSADSLTLGLQSLGTKSSKTVILSPVSGTNGFETLNIELTGGASGKDGKFVVIDDGSATTLATVNVSGSANGALDLTTPASVTTVDASKATGNLVFNLAYGEDVKVTGGSGNDEFQFGGFLTPDDTIVGGNGTDTLTAKDVQFANFTSPASNISGIERIRIQNSAAATIDVSNFVGVKYVRVEDRNTNTLILDNLPNGSTIRFDNDASTAANALKISNAAGGKADSITLDLRASNNFSTTANVTATIDNVETINVTTEDAKNPAKLNLTADDAASKGYTLTVNLTGDEDITLTLTSDHAKNIVDGSTMTASLNADLSAVTGHATLKGGSAADTLIGGAAEDTLTGNGGKDIFVFNNFGAVDTITDFSATADDIYINAAPTVFNASAAPNGIATTTSMVYIWKTTGTSTLVPATMLNGTISMKFGLTSKELFVKANKSALISAVKAVASAHANARGVAFGKVGTILYLVYVGDGITTIAHSGTTIVVRTIAHVGAGFSAADLFLF